MVTKSEKTKVIVKKLSKEYDSKTPLDHKNNFQLLIAVILSAQCTDAQVNKVTPGLFKVLKTPKDFANATIPKIEKLIRSIGLYKSKAKNIKAASEIIVEKHKGKVPQTMEGLVELPGVGRKTANVLMFHAFGKAEGVIVDTHVGRLAVRIGLASTDNTKDAIKIEKDLMKCTDKKQWGDLSLYLIKHGRVVCTARKAFCDNCSISHVCKSSKKLKEYSPNL